MKLKTKQKLGSPLPEAHLNQRVNSKLDRLRDAKIQKYLKYYNIITAFSSFDLGDLVTIVLSGIITGHYCIVLSNYRLDN